MRILDCTLRDGGYYNNWDFSEEIVEAYLDKIAKSGIDYVELGLRNFPKSDFLGAFAFTTENYLNSIELPSGPIYGVMIDAKTILESGYPIIDALDILFTPSYQSKIGLVRVAAHFKEAHKCGEIVNHLKDLGYTVGFNLMQASGKSCESILEIAKLISQWESVDVLYFADSLGNMDVDEVKRVIKSLRKGWNGTLGIHTHNNMNKGLENTLVAYNCGVEWLDVTITGMGRGAGNTPTENLLAVLDNNRYCSRPVYELVIRHFESMKKEYGWGSNLLYFLGAQRNVHPTYIQNLLSNSHYGTDEIIGAIDYLSQIEGSTSYNGAVLNTALNFSSKDNNISGSNELSGTFDGENIVILANGPSLIKYNSAIKQYISQLKPIVLSVNIVESIPQEYIDYYIISHNSKFLSDSQKYKDLGKTIILPKHRFTKTEQLLLENIDFIDYGIEIKPNELRANESYATIPYDITIAYVLAVLMESTPKTISIVGFDGYESNDPRQNEMIKIIELLMQKDTLPSITSLTPTTYPISKGSIYAPII